MLGQKVKGQSHRNKSTEMLSSVRRELCTLSSAQPLVVLEMLKGALVSLKPVPFTTKTLLQALDDIKRLTSITGMRPLGGQFL